VGSSKPATIATVVHREGTSLADYPGDWD
jgi:hypothetical protein